TTALVASAGIASAQGVALSGSAEMGIIGGTGMEVQFHSDIDVTFTLSGETDNGLTFGATIDLDEVGDDCTTATATEPAGIDIDGDGTFGGTFTFCEGGDPIGHTGRGSGTEEHSVWMSGSFGTITLGDTDGAFDWAMQEVGIGSALTDDHTTHAGFSGNSGADGTYDGQIARYDHTFGDFSFAVSVELDDSTAATGDPVFGVGGKYSTELGAVTLGVGLGYQKNAVLEIVGVSLDATFSNGFRAILNYSDFGGSIVRDDSGIGGFAANTYDSHWGIGVGYTMDALTVSANYGVYSQTTCAGCADAEGFGLAANYDLGGGAVVQAGYGHSSVQNPFVAGATAEADTWSLGVAMSF
ncbi:MAG: porin, partial [Rhodobacteraceae bacterium]|nr:porin [Paracoccaceae bacterium]